MNRDTNWIQEKSEELIASLLKLRDVLEGFEEPHVLKELLRFEEAKELFGAFTVVYQKMAATAENPSPLIAGNIMNADEQPVQSGSWHEYGFSLLRFFQSVYSGLVRFKSSEGEPNGIPIHTVTVQIRREMAFALLKGFQVGFDEEAAIGSDAKLEEAIKKWNDGSTWRQVAESMGRGNDQSKATQMELKRFAKKNNIEIRKGKPGRTKS